VARPIRFGAILLALAAIALAGARWFDRQPAADPAPKALTASLRSEPTRYNRYVEATAAGDLVSLLVDGRLVRIDRAADAVLPGLAESWSVSPDGLTWTLALRRGVRFSDGTPFTSADVLFSARALYDPAVNSPLASSMRIAGEPVAFAAPDDFTVTMTLPAPFAPGLQLLDHLPILPRHRLEAPLANGQFAEAWSAGTPLDQLAGLGPFVLTEHVAGQRMVFARNPHYWRTDDEGVRLPYLDGLTVLVIPDQNTEGLRMAAGDIDLMSNGDISPDDYATFKRASDEGRLRLIDVGVGLDANQLWFNLTPAAQARLPWLHDRRVRQAISYAVDRQAIADTVHLGLGVPIYGPVTPGNRTWASPSAPQYPFDPARARQLLAEAGLADRDGDGTLDDARGLPVRFSIATQKGHTLRERTAAVVQEQLRQVGIRIDVTAMDPQGLFGRWQSGDYDSIYMGVQASATDPALNQDFWLSSGAYHFWHPRQPAPATEWEARIDELMRRLATTQSPPERQQLFAEVQRIFGEEQPALYFVAPRVTIAVTPRVGNPTPVLQAPQLLWSADTLSIDPGR
jgi:peptide/nickel transport system substrate-binding protein